MNEDDERVRPSAWRGWEMWIACVLAAIMPTAVLATVVQWVDGKAATLFVPALFLGLVAVMVLAMRPWTFR